MKIPLHANGRWYDEDAGEIVAWTEVDDEDYAELAQHRWHLDPAGYAIRWAALNFPDTCPACGWLPKPGIHSARSISNHHTKAHGTRITAARRERIPMHRAIAGLRSGDPRQVDHINRDRLHNRRANLRIIEANVQAQNRTKPATHKGKPTESKYRGVYKVKKDGVWHGKWKASVDQHYLGSFASEEAAAEAASRYRLETMTAAID